MESPKSTLKAELQTPGEQRCSQLHLPHPPLKCVSWLSIASLTFFCRYRRGSSFSRGNTSEMSRRIISNTALGSPLKQDPNSSKTASKKSDHGSNSSNKCLIEQVEKVPWTLRQCVLSKKKRKKPPMCLSVRYAKNSIFFGNFLKGLMFLGFSSKQIHRNQSENEHIPCNT